MARQLNLLRDNVGAGILDGAPQLWGATKKPPANFPTNEPQLFLHHAEIPIPTYKDSHNANLKH